MNTETAIESVQTALWTAAVLAAPALIVVFLVSFVVSFLQALTQIQDQTLSFVPRLLAGAAALLYLLPWMLDRLGTYVTEAYANVGLLP